MVDSCKESRLGNYGMRSPTRGIKVTKNREARKDWALRKIFLPLKIDASPSSASPPLNAAKSIYFVSDVNFFFCVQARLLPQLLWFSMAY